MTNEIDNIRLIELVKELLSSIDNNCYEHSEKLKIIKCCGITKDELEELGFDYIKCWLEDAEDDWDDYWEDDEDYIPSSTNGDYSPSHPWDAPGMSIRDFI